MVKPYSPNTPEMRREAKSESKTARVYYLDWLRVLIILNLVPWHAAWFMAYTAGFSDSVHEGPGLTVLRYYTGFSLRWQIPLLFFMLVCYPVLLCFWPGASGDKSLSDYLFRFWPHCLTTIHDSRMPGRAPMPGWAHLWFVAYLLIFSLICLPLFICLKSQGEKGMAGKYVSFFIKRGTILLPAVPLIAINIILSPKWPMAQLNLYDDWTYFCYDLIVFIFGYVFCLHERLWQAIDKHLPISLALAIISTVFVLAMQFELPAFSHPAYTLRYMLYSVFLGLHTWCWILAFMAIAKRYLSGTNRFLKYARQACYPFYILHFLLMVVIGHFITKWGLGMAGEFISLSFLTFIAALASYELLVKRTKVTRVLFGMKA